MSGRRLSDFVAPVLFGVGVLVLWQLIVRGFNVPQVLLPAPSDIGSKFFSSLPILWVDFVQTFVRIPAGAFLAWGAMGNEPAATQFIAALAGGFISSGTHLFKSGGRVLINTSPEPVSNWVTSFSEDGLLVVGLWLAIQHPWIFLILLGLFLAMVIWLLPKLFRLVAKVFRGLRRKLIGADPIDSSPYE